MVDPRVAIVLDSTAILAYTRESIAVGEIIAEVSDEHLLVGLPLPCLVQAYLSDGDRQRLDVLAGHSFTTVLADEPQSWRWLARTSVITESYEKASAAVLALGADVSLLTAEPEIYAGLGDADLVIAFDDE